MRSFSIGGQKASFQLTDDERSFLITCRYINGILLSMYYIKFIIPDLTQFVKVVLGIIDRFYKSTLFKTLRRGGGRV